MPFPQCFSFRLLLSGLLLATFAAAAQPKPYYFSLAEAKPDAVPGAATTPWHVARVLDLRADRSRVGSVHRGLDNQLASAGFAQALAPELLQFFQAQLPPRAGTRPVLMRVFTLALSEDIRASSENAEAELVADFLEPQADSTFRVLLAVGETIRRGGLDVTKFHPTNLAVVLRQALGRLAAVPAPTAAPETLSRADALGGRGGAAAQRFAIQAAAAPKRGLYRSLQEFRDNAPSEPDYPFVFEHVAHTGKRWAGTDDVQPLYLQTDAQHPRRPVSTSGLWGLSDGKELLMVYRNQFYKLLPGADGRSYTFMGPPLFDAQAATNMAAASVAGGLLGAAIAGAANGARPMDLYELHLATGRVVPGQEAAPTDADGFALAPDTARVYVYRRANSPQGQPLTLNVAGQAPLVLAARQFATLRWTDRRRELKVCAQLGPDPGACREFVPDFSQPTYFECVVPPGGGAAELRPVPAKEGAFELRRIQLLAKSKKKPG